MKIECRQIKKQLSEYLDGELNPRGLEEIKKHLAGCAGCSSELDSMKKAINAFKGAKAAPPPFLESRIMAAVNGLDRDLTWGISVSGRKLIPLFGALFILLIAFSLGSITNPAISPVEEYVQDSLSLDNNSIFLKESPVTESDMLDTFINL